MIRFVVLNLMLLTFAFAICLGQTPEPDSNLEEDPKEEQPYWYQPGHPINPAEALSITTLEGFKVNKFYNIPTEFGSWTAITSDDKGRLICAAQHQTGLYRLSIGGSDPNDST